MSSLRSSLLIIGHPSPETVSLGAEFASSCDEAHILLNETDFAVIATSTQVDTPEQVKKLLDQIASNKPETMKILINYGLPAEVLKTFAKSGFLFKILPNFSEPQFSYTLQIALEEHALARQNTELLDLINDQNTRLKRLSIELEQRVEKRQKYLMAARKKLLTSNDRIEALHRALVAVHRASSVGELEVLVQEALLSALGLDWIRIIFRSQSLFQEQIKNHQLEFDIFSTPLSRGQEHIGHIYFARSRKNKFKKDEHGFLLQVADAVALSIDRLSHLQEAQTLKQQWEATFDAISSPVSLINENHEIIRCNKSFAEKAGKPIQAVIGGKCHKILFSEEKPCNHCHLGQSFQLPPRKTTSDESFIFDVSSQKVGFENLNSPLFFMLYHDISEEKRLEAQILESAKMVELGTIGGSIAHELNNPLGGMISFLQLIKMDLKGDESFFEDVCEMEKGAMNCKEIVQNLLHFTRRSTVDSTEEFDLREVIDSAVKITELQTRSQGLSIRVSEEPGPAVIKGQFNLLTQAIRQVLEIFCKHLQQFVSSNPGQSGTLELYLKTINENTVLLFSADITSLSDIEKKSNQSHGIDLRITRQILDEHSARLDFSAAEEEKFTAKITFSRLENLEKSQDFDA